MTIAIYPGSFDPLTNGHLDIVTRASRLFEKVVVAVFDKPDKRLLFATKERVQLAREAAAHLPNVSVTYFSGLTVDFANKLGASVLVRGLRMVSDFEHEFEMALMNKKLAPELELVCFMTNVQYQFISSSILKDVAKLGGCLDGLVPANVAAALAKRLPPKC